MHVVLWDTRKLDVAKDFAGGFGVGQYHGFGGFRGRIIRWAYKRDRRPVALNFAYLAAILRKLGHTVQYSEDRVPTGGDLYVFNPSLITLHLEIAAIHEVLAKNPRAKVLITGLVAYALPEAFDGLDVTIVRGEPEKLLWKLDDVLSATARTVDVGSVRELDHLPFPDWSLFGPSRFRIGYDFTRFPTGLIQQSRGCTFTCNYCPYIVVENATRFRTPESVFDELRHGIETYGFRSFKFRDPLFGLDRKRVLRLAELIGRLPRKIQFSIESRIDLLRPETLKALREVGLTSITVGIETPDEDTLRHYKRAPVKDDKQRDFVTLCRGLGIRTVAGFMIGFPEDTVNSIRGVLHYAKAVNPTYANFNIVTPYPGTEFFAQVKDQIANFDFTKYTVYTPVMKYQHLTAEQVQYWHAKCFMRFFFRWEWLTSNAHVLWPSLRLLGVGRKYARHAAVMLATKARGAPAADQATPAATASGALPIAEHVHRRTDGAHVHAVTDKPAATKKRAT
ncbi:MAG: radical SAM protein [Planctomycetia bacterium]|nr:radical SAM protein [Planctomycetia bacterium]